MDDEPAALPTNQVAEILEHPPKPRQLPSDLPTSLDDRRPVSLTQDIEVYDAWQGQSQILSTPASAPLLNFNLSLDEPNDDLGYNPSASATAERRLDQMLAAQAAHREGGLLGDDREIVANEQMSDNAKRDALQQSLFRSASNGDVARLNWLLVGAARRLVDIDTPDEEGTAPLIYASCFGHEDIVTLLLDAGAKVDQQDRNAWTSLMWATANRHRNIVQILLDRGASLKAKSSTGRTASDFAAPDSELSDYLHDGGYKIGSTGVAEDFYTSGLSQERFEEEMADNEMKRRMMMESAINLEVDLGNLGLDEHPETPEDAEEDQEEFIWDRCLNDQMFVFQESDLGRLLDVVITKMTPQRSSSQKPIPANVLFLSARYAHYHVNSDLLHRLLISAMDKINEVVENMQGDMTVLAFWMSNATLLLHYLKKDMGLMSSTTEAQVQLADLINEIFVLIIRDAERRMDKVLDTAMLDHETIAGFEDIQFQNEWKFFRSKPKVKAPESMAKRFRPPSPQRRAKVSPRNITSLLSSTLFVLDLYDIHSVIATQILAQLLYWLGAELFNRIMSNRKYLSRTKAMQMRMNVSFLEDWALNNNRHPEHYESGSTRTIGEATVDAARYHLAPVSQLLQWLQVCTSLGENIASLRDTIQQLPRLSPQQLIHAVKYYRAEVGEKGLPKLAMKLLVDQQKDLAAKKERQRKSIVSLTSETPGSAISEKGISPGDKVPISPSGLQSPVPGFDVDDIQDHLLLDPALMLPFSLPTSMDMVISYGAGFGGINRERARKYIPTVPPEILAKLDVLEGRRRSSGLYNINNNNNNNHNSSSSNKTVVAWSDNDEDDNHIDNHSHDNSR